MNQNYSEYILRKLASSDAYERTYDELQELSPEEALDMILRYEGIFGYTTFILNWIQDLYKVKLSRYGLDQSRQDFVQGLGNIFAAEEIGGVTAMRMDEDDIVTLFFEDGGTHHANCAMDSKRAIISDIMKQGF